VLGRPPILAVSHALETDVFLHAYDCADGCILNPSLFVDRNPALCEIVPGSQDVRGAKEAADVVGSKWRNSMHAE